MSVAAFAIMGTGYLFFAPQLPEVESLKDVRLQTPLKVYTREGQLIAVFGEKRRIPLDYEEFPQAVINAFLAAEDDRFFVHPGVDYQGLIRAAIQLLITGEKKQGGSTITMQVARNFFLSPERRYSRKIKEILLALRIEKALTKPEILQLYLNKIFLGQRAYGVGAAAEVYYGKQVAELTLPQIAMIAGLPKAPSHNPLSNPNRALNRRNYVLGRMLDLEMISDEEYTIAKASPIEARRYTPPIQVEAAYVGEMVRAEMLDRFGEDYDSSGYRVYTTIEANRQRAAVTAVQRGILAYDVRHGFRGAEGKIPLDQLTGPRILADLMANMSPVSQLQPGIVTNVNEDQALVTLADEDIQLNLESVQWARAHKSENSLGPKPKKVSDVLQVGDIIRVLNTKRGWQLRQIPEVSSALVSLRPEDGAIVALTGGFNFYHSKFNRATQAYRQPGSAFKPFIYSAALEAGFTAASIKNDAPVVFEDRSQEDTWRPHNYSGKFFGPTRLRVALTKSRNMISIRLLRDIGRRVAHEHAGKFGFDLDKLPKDLTLALGSGAVAPIQLARAYSVFANGGYQVEPYFIDRIEGPDGEVIFQSNPLRVCDEECTRLAAEIALHAEELAEMGLSENLSDEGVGIRVAPRVISDINVFQMDSMLKDVIRFGTGRRALDLKRADIAGKTGTTNDQHDAWFSGYHPQVVTTVWLGFDQHRPLGRGEVGGVAALPIWIDYMRVALQDLPYIEQPKPDGIVELRINPETGLLVDQNSGVGIPEIFPIDNIPAMDRAFPNLPNNLPTTGSTPQSQDLPEHIF